jgi:predicted DNA-binding WGR domain protein
MSRSKTEPLHLRRIDPARNMARFYGLSIQPTLFGGASLVRNWGRIGTKGQMVIKTFDEDVGVGEAFLGWRAASARAVMTARSRVRRKRKSEGPPGSIRASLARITLRCGGRWGGTRSG